MRYGRTFTVKTKDKTPDGLNERKAKNSLMYITSVCC
jgi:hypothetical protein